MKVVMMNSLLSSHLYNNETFYKTFEKDIRKAKEFVVIESPFITMKRIDALLPAIIKLRRRGVLIVVNTRHSEEHQYPYSNQAEEAVCRLQELKVRLVCTVKHHRKLAIIDDEILWEGSLNILSQNDSCEVMRRSVSSELVNQKLSYIGARRWL